MSGIFGVYRLDHAPVDPDILAAMSACLSHRGPDNAGAWCEGSIGLGQRMLRTTPESLHEKLPFALPEANLAITADGRIDNREELATRLAMSNAHRDTLTDSDFMLAAYQKWGEHCPKMLVGDFAFAIWDGRRKILFCARDRFGVRPFYYHHTSQVFAFGSEVKAIHCLPEAPRTLNERMVGYYLGWGVAENGITFYQDIFRLPPAHYLVVSSGHIQLQRYWTPNPVQELRFTSDEEYIEAFRDKFRLAVRSCLRSAFPIASDLSGGLDSSSVTCMARALLGEQGQTSLPTFSAFHDIVIECDERPFIQPVVDQGGLTPHFIAVDDINPLADMERMVWLSDEPVTSPTVYIPWEMYRLAQMHGIRVVLTGLDGDSTVSHGWEYLIELARGGRWADFARQAHLIGQHPNLPSSEMLAAHYGMAYLAGLARRWQWFAFMRNVNAIHHHLRISRKYLVKYCGFEPLIVEPLKRRRRTLYPDRAAYAGEENLVHPEFARRIGLKEQQIAAIFAYTDAPQTQRAAHAQHLASAIIPFAFEWDNRVTTAFGLEGRHPFADVRLVEFCLALPPEQKLTEGWTRAIVRRAMAGLLPEKVRWRGGKTVNSEAFLRSFRLHCHAQIQSVLEKDPTAIEGYANMRWARRIYRRYLANEATHGEVDQLWRVVTLALWLRHTNLAA